MRTESASSRYAARLGVATVLVTALAACGGNDSPSGAAAPVKPGGADAGGTPSVAGPGSGPAPGPGSGSASPNGTAADGSAQAATRTVAAYFAEINEACRAGRVADVSATALPGCQTCSLDIGVTRRFSQRGQHTDIDPYQVRDLRAGERVGTVGTVSFTAVVRPVRLLDLAGRQDDTDPGVPAKPGIAKLVLTAAGWRIQTIEYSRGPT